MMDYFNVKVNGTNVRRGVHNLSPFDIAGLAKKKDAIFVLGNAMVPQDYTMPSSLTVNNDNNNNSNNSNSSGGGTSLHFYCKYGKDVEILQSMVEIRPALVDVLDDFGYTPFLIACKAKESALSDEYPRLKFLMDSSLISLSEKYVFAIFLPSVDFQSVS